MNSNGGYDDGYLHCPCFWGEEPGSLVRLLCEFCADWAGHRVLDAGCGEGKNAVFLARRGASVEAFDISQSAIDNARRHWGNVPGVSYDRADVVDLVLAAESYHCVVGYGLCHCLPDRERIAKVLDSFQVATRVGGYNVLCAFNDRSHDMSAHPTFEPTLLPHAAYVEQYRGWRILHSSDTDLHETHPHNGIPHWHSMTRILAQKI
jgi:tellurite methyltransferase